MTIIAKNHGRFSRLSTVASHNSARLKYARLSMLNDMKSAIPCKLKGHWNPSRTTNDIFILVLELSVLVLRFKLEEQRNEWERVEPDCR